MIQYDDALPEFAAVVQELLGADAVLDHLFLRDAAGRLTFVVLKLLAPDILAQLRERAAKLAPWVDPDSSVAEPEDLFDDTLRDPEVGFLERIDHLAFHGFVRVVERRIVGQDWLRSPLEPIPGAPPVVVFASHKGGVGRSTALAVSAIALSREGFNLLVIDLDLEAPGLGQMLLGELPTFGTLDFFVEAGVAEINDDFLDDMVMPSTFAGRGLLHVVPAAGAKANANPQNVLGKIARAYVEKIGSDGSVVSFLDQVRVLVDRLRKRYQYDGILIDARAGLNEATAGAFLGLGAEILLFGVDTPQTHVGYRYLLAHLARFRPEASGDNDWRYRLRMVQAKARGGPEAEAQFRTHAFDLFSETLYDSKEGIDEEAFNFDYDDSSAPHYAWPIQDDANYAEFNPLAQAAHVASHMYDRTFGPFIAALREKTGLKP